MDADELQHRAKAFSLRVMKLVDALPNRVAAREIGRQLVRSAMSVSANYRAARRGRSRKEFVAKIGIVVEEVDESAHWLDLLIEGGIMTEKQAAPLRSEAEELTRIFSSTRRTARRNESARAAGNVARRKPITKSPNCKIAK